jgi:hypothetical protein
MAKGRLVEGEHLLRRFSKKRLRMVEELYDNIGRARFLSVREKIATEKCEDNPGEETESCRWSFRKRPEPV